MHRQPRWPAGPEAISAAGSLHPPSPHGRDATTPVKLMVGRIALAPRSASRRRWATCRRRAASRPADGGARREMPGRLHPLQLSLGHVNESSPPFTAKVCRRRPPATDVIERPRARTNAAAPTSPRHGDGRHPAGMRCLEAGAGGAGDGAAGSATADLPCVYRSPNRAQQQPEHRHKKCHQHGHSEQPRGENHGPAPPLGWPNPKAPPCLAVFTLQWPRSLRLGRVASLRGLTY
jgi:hypothetical protein